MKDDIEEEYELKSIYLIAYKEEEITSSTGIVKKIKKKINRILYITIVLQNKDVLGVMLFYIVMK